MRFPSAPTPFAGIRTSSKPFNRIVSHYRCQPFAITGFPPVIHNAECLSRREKLKRGELFNDNATTLFRLQWQALIGTRRSGRRSNLKRSLGGSAFRETLQELCSRMRTPRFGVNWRLSVFDARVTETIQTNSDTQTIVLGFKVYSRTCGIVQGGIKNVTCSYAIHFLSKLTFPLWVISGCKAGSYRIRSGARVGAKTARATRSDRPSVFPSGPRPLRFPRQSLPEVCGAA